MIIWAYVFVCIIYNVYDISKHKNANDEHDNEARNIDNDLT